MATVEVATGDPAVGLQQLRASSSTAEQSVRKSMHKTVPSWIDRCTSLKSGSAPKKPSESLERVRPL
jgi:hypothetical protein